MVLIHHQFGKNKKGCGKIKQSKKYRARKHASDLQLMYDRKEEYNHLISIGYTQEQAIKKLRNSPPLKGIEKLNIRYQRAFKRQGTDAISLKGIKVNAEINRFIKQHHLTKVGDTLYFPKNVKMERGSPYSVKGESTVVEKRIRTIPFDFSATARPQFIEGRLTIPQDVLEQSKQQRAKKAQVARQTTRQRNFEERQRALDEMPFPERAYVETDDEKVADKISDYVKKHPGIIMRGIAGGAEAGRAIWYPATDRTTRMEFIADRKGLDDLIDFLHKFKGKIKYDAGF